MLESRKTELKVGLAVVLSIVILVGGILWGKGYRLSVARYKIMVEFSNIGGLETGSNVMANGVVQGRVGAIELRSGRVFVEAHIDKSVTIYSDYVITIESPTLMAGKALAIYPGSQAPTADVNTTLKGTDPLGMTEAMAVFQEISADVTVTLGNLNNLLVNLNTMAGDTGNQQNLSGLLRDASSTASQASSFLAANRDQLATTLDKLDSAATSFQRVAAVAESRFGSTINSLDSTAKEVSGLVQSARGILDKLQGSDNTAGRLLNDDSLYVQLSGALAEIDSLARDIRKNGMKQKIILF